MEGGKALDIKEYKCGSCERLNNYSDEMRCGSCGFLHNKDGTPQKFSLGIIYNGQTIEDLQSVNELELRMVLGLSSVSDDTWIKTLEVGKYTVGTLEYYWEKVDNN